MVAAAVLVAATAGIVWWNESRKNKPAITSSNQSAQVNQSEPPITTTPETPPANTNQQDPTKNAQQPKTTGTQAPVVITGKITAYVTDQYGNAFGGPSFGYSPELLQILRKQYGNSYKPSGGSSAHFELYDSLGEQIMTGHISVKDGYLESPELPSGKYTLIVPQRPTISQTPVVVTIDLPTKGVNLGTLKVMQWGAVRAKITNEVGTAIGARLVLKKCEITDQYVKEADANRYPKNAPSECARLNNNAVPWNLGYEGLIGTYPSGNYTVEISNYDYGSVEKSFSVNNRDVDLGTIVLKK